MATKTTPADAPADDSRTEAEKAGADPVSKPVEPEKVTLTDVGVREPYPTGGAPDPEAAFEAAHGFRREKK